VVTQNQVVRDPRQQTRFSKKSHPQILVVHHEGLLKPTRVTDVVTEVAVATLAVTALLCTCCNCELT